MEVVIAAGIMGGIAVALMFLTQQQTKQTVRSKIDADLAMAKSEIIGLMNNPSHCNANFKNLTAGVVITPNAGLTDLYSCAPAAACATNSATNKTSKFKVIASGWPGLPGALQGQISERVKITKIERTVVGSTVGANAVNSASMKITFTVRPLNAPEVSQIVNFPVTIITSGNNVVGCPKSANSTIPY